MRLTQQKKKNTEAAACVFQTFIKKETPTPVFSRQFCESFNDNFSWTCFFGVTKSVMSWIPKNHIFEHSKSKNTPRLLKQGLK